MSGSGSPLGPLAGQRHFKLPQGLATGNEQGKMHIMWHPLQMANEDPLVPLLRISRLYAEHSAGQGVLLSTAGPRVIPTGSHPQNQLDSAWPGAGPLANSEPHTFHEPCDSCFGEKQHSAVNVMQQVVQRETVDAQDRVQSVKT